MNLRAAQPEKIFYFDGRQQALNAVRTLILNLNFKKILEDVNRKKRISMWGVFVVSIITIPLFIYVDNKHFTESELLAIDNLILSKDSEYDPGGGKSSPPSIKFHFTNTDRGFILTYEEYQCVTNSIILTNFKKGDTVSIKILKSDVQKFHSTNWFNKYSKIYGLAKNGKSYLSLACRNNVSDKRTHAATMASISSALLSLIFAVVFLRPKTKYEALGQLPIDPILIVFVVWLIICIGLR